MCWSSFWQTMPTMTPFICQSNHMGSSTTIYKSIPWDGSFCICSSQQRNEILARVLSYVIRLFWKLWEMTRRLFFLFSFNALTWNSRIPTEKFDKGTVILKTSHPENITFKSQSHAIARLLLSCTLWDSRLMSSPTHIVCWFRMTSPMLCHLSTNNLYACRKQCYRKTVPPTCLARRVSARLNVQIDRSELASRNNAIARLFPRFSRDSKMVENDVSNVLFPKSRNIMICCWRWSWAAGLASKAKSNAFSLRMKLVHGSSFRMIAQLHFSDRTGDARLDARVRRVEVCQACRANGPGRAPSPKRGFQGVVFDFSAWDP